ncbi:hypothetical protein REPUB_Repub03eG0100400 [Reevesia pubescens]
MEGREIGEERKKERKLSLFNVDGSAFGKPGPAGIGEVPRDEDGSVKLLFSKSVGSTDSNLAEFLELESVNAVKWINSPQTAPWKLRKYCAAIEHAKAEIFYWKVFHVPMECNEADEC